MRKNVRKKWMVVVLSVIFVVVLSGCGTKVEETEQIAESSEADNVDEIENVSSEENASDFTGAEDENIVLYAEIAEYGEYGPQKDNTFESVNNVLVAPENVPVFNGDGIEVGYIKNGSTISITGSALNYWARFENPIAGTDYDYLYVMKDYIVDSEEVHLNAVSMAQGIEDYIVKWFPVDVDATPTILDEKASDMEIYECRMDSTYSDEMDYEYWFLEQFIRKDEFKTSDYKTFYVECEEDTDGRIICRVYYKDPIE